MTSVNSEGVRHFASEEKQKTKLVNKDLRLKIARIYEAEPGNPFIIRFDGILRDSAHHIACIAGMNYESLSAMERFLLTRFRCSLCGVLPFYFLDLKHLNRIRCGKCSMLVGLKNSGKYGKLKKKIAISACKTIDETLDFDEDRNRQHDKSVPIQHHFVKAFPTTCPKCDRMFDIATCTDKEESVDDGRNTNFMICQCGYVVRHS